MVHQRNWWILARVDSSVPQHTMIWVILVHNPDPDHPKGMHVETSSHMHDHWLSEKKKYLSKLLLRTWHWCYMYMKHYIGFALFYTLLPCSTLLCQVTQYLSNRNSFAVHSTLDSWLLLAFTQKTFVNIFFLIWQMLGIK